jgi:hypothetical protein
LNSIQQRPFESDINSVFQNHYTVTNRMTGLIEMSRLIYQLHSDKRNGSVTITQTQNIKYQITKVYATKH